MKSFITTLLFSTLMIFGPSALASDETMTPEWDYQLTTYGARFTLSQQECWDLSNTLIASYDAADASNRLQTYFVAFVPAFAASMLANAIVKYGALQLLDELTNKNGPNGVVILYNFPDQLIVTAR